MSEAALSIKSVDKIYEGRGKGPVHAVKNLDMDVQRGEIVALLGSSGCGKTSTLRMIAGFEEVTHGDIVLEGRRVNQMPPARRKVAMAFEGYSLYPPLTVRDNIAFALKSAHMSAKDVQRSVAEVARILEIEPILDRYPTLDFGRRAAARKSRSGARASGGSLSPRRTDGSARASAARRLARPTEEPFGRSPHDRDLCHSRPDRSQRAR